MNWEKKDFIKSMEIWRTDHLPIIRAYCDKIELVQTINNIVPTEMKIKPGIIVKGLIFDTLAGTMKVFSEITLKACKVYEIEKKHLHYDTTSVSVWGDYAYLKNGRRYSHNLWS